MESSKVEKTILILSAKKSNREKLFETQLNLYNVIYETCGISSRIDFDLTRDFPLPYT